MAKQRLDYSFVREGRNLRSWLRNLVADDAPTRLAAGEALQAMQHAVPSVHTDLEDLETATAATLDAHRKRFDQAIRNAVDSPAFDGPGFVHGLIRYLIELNEDWQRRVAEKFGRDRPPNAREERLLRRIREADGEEARAEATRRYMRWTCAKIARDSRPENDPYTGAESFTAGAFMAQAVFDALDTALLGDRPGLHRMLDVKQLRHDALAALARIGPPAVDFAPIFLERLDAGGFHSVFDEARALGAIGRDDPKVVDGLLRRLHSGPMEVRVAAAQALACAGPPLAGRVEVAIDLLLGATGSTELVCAATSALGTIGFDSEVALARVLEVATPRAPRWDSEDVPLEYREDAVMIERATAIGALGEFRGFADRIVPVLIDAFDTFEDFDPDWSYHGEHGRVCVELEAFGPEAAPAVPRLIRYLGDWAARPEDEQGDWPKDVFGLLAAIGPKAGAALPILERLRVMFADGDVPPDTLDPDDPLDGAILAIQPDRAGA